MHIFNYTLINYGVVARIVTVALCSLLEEVDVGMVNLRLNSLVALCATLVSKGNNVLAEEKVSQLVPFLENSQCT